MSPARLIFICCPGGGAAGANQAGALKAIHETFGLAIDGMSGASVGALNMAMYCQDQIPELEALWKGMRTRHVYSRWRLARPKVCSPSLYNPRPLHRLIDERIDPERLKHCPFPAMATAIDFDSAEKRVFSIREPGFAEALKASSAIPVVFPPIQIGGRFYVDGGVHDNTPTEPLIELASRAGRDALIIMPHCHPASEPADRKRTPNVWTYAVKTLDLLFRANQHDDTRRIEATNRRIAEGRGDPNHRHIEVLEIYPPRRIGTLQFGPRRAAAGFDAMYRHTGETLAAYLSGRKEVA